MKVSISIFPLGDSAITVDLGNLIEEQLNRKVLAISSAIRAAAVPGVADIIIAYSSVTVFYDPLVIIQAQPRCPDGAYGWIKKQLEKICSAPAGSGTEMGGSAFLAGRENEMEVGPLIRIPVCYEKGFAPDLELLARKKGLSREEIISLHVSGVYRVYMIGFLPGFPYMGTVDPVLVMPRKDRPIAVAAGGVGIAGNQTGIYPVDSPGGWQIIGRTPLLLFDPHAAVPVGLRAGDRVQFFSIGSAAFREYGSVPASMPFKPINDRCF